MFDFWFDSGGSVCDHTVVCPRADHHCGVCVEHCLPLVAGRKHGEEGIGQLGHFLRRAPWDLLPLSRPQLPELLQPSTSHLGSKHSIYESALEHCMFKSQSWNCVMLRECESLWDVCSHSQKSGGSLSVPSTHQAPGLWRWLCPLAGWHSLLMLFACQCHLCKITGGANS